jgi:hypothetical protein
MQFSVDRANWCNKFDHGLAAITQIVEQDLLDKVSFVVLYCGCGL